MTAKSPLTDHLPAPVGSALEALGSNLKTARLRRGLTAQQIAGRIGVSRQVVADAESGKPTTSVAVYVALLWALGLLDQLAYVGDPTRDKVGLAASLLKGARPDPTDDW